ncbi:transcriptional regulator, TetR family [Natronincola peptidivorans]|uniref:Transcriptional regulator, TetR family n=1 Tax=Natronincola peptidivorans TaxID=426128 RepID=A0A1I0DR92_9FIRM|nr:TetR/AcrR family transcriptional regulator [Natronincola peptidivorans]SET35103.1 transcriptional regulator, TetR family [Natronincola peptidivorans]
MIKSTGSDDRKKAFLQTALELFYQKGYEHTKITDICEKMDVTKGAFYHYFDSKEDVIIALGKAFTERGTKIINEVFKRDDLTTVEKFNKALVSVNEYKIREREWRLKFKTAIETDENLKLQHIVTNSLKMEVSGLYEELIDMGVKEGVFGDPVNSSELAEFFLNTIFSLNVEVDKLEKELYDKEKKSDYQSILNKLETKLRFHEVMLKRIFQLQEGEFDLITPYFLRVKGGE